MKIRGISNFLILVCLLFVGHLSYAQNTSKFERVKIEKATLSKYIYTIIKGRKVTITDNGRDTSPKKSRYDFMLPKLKAAELCRPYKIKMLDKDEVICNHISSQSIEHYSNLHLYRMKGGVIKRGYNPKSYVVSWEGEDESCREYDVRMPLPELEVSLADAPVGSGVNKNLVITNVSDKKIELIPEKNRTEQYSIKTEGDNIIPIAAKDSYTLTIEPLDSCDISDLEKGRKDMVIKFLYTVDGDKSENKFAIKLDVSCDWSQERIQASNIELENYLQGNTTKLEEANKDIAFKNEKIEQLNGDIEKLYSQVEELNKNNVLKDKDLEVLRNKVEELYGQIDELNKNNHLKDKDLEEFRSKVEELNSQLEGSSKNITLKDSKIAELNSKIEEFNGQLDESSKNVISLNDKIEELRGQLEESDKNITLKDSEITELNGKVEELNGQLGESNKNVTSLNDKIEELRGQLEESGKNITLKDRKITELSGKVEELNDQLGESSKNIVSLNDKVGELHGQLEESGKNITLKDSEIADLNGKIEELNGQLGESHKNVVSLNSKIEDLHGQLEESGKNITLKDSEIAELRNSNTLQNKKIEQLEKKIEEVEGDYADLLDFSE